MKFLKDPVPEEQIRTRPKCSTPGCKNPVALHSAYNKRQKFKSVCTSCHNLYLKELKREREEREKLLESINLTKFIDGTIQDVDHSHLKRHYTLRPVPSENSLEEFL